MKIRLVQFDIGSDVDENLETAIKLANFQPTSDVDVVVFPEMFTTGFTRLEKIGEQAHDLTGPVIKRFKALAKSSTTNLVLGSLAIKNPINSSVTNSTLIINRQGKIISRYDKINLFSLMNEPKYLEPGSQTHLFKLDGHLCSSVICYDLRFPELMSDTLKKKPFDLLFVPAQWPSPREEMFTALARARAIENQSFVVFVNSVTSKKADFPGCSLVINPLGEIIFNAKKKIGGFDVIIDLEEIKLFRSQIPALTTRKNLINKLKI